ncbi:MAG: carboxypeptidase M32 [Bacteroidota bacterium]
MSYQDFTERMSKIADVNYSIAVLHWDKEVNLPPKGAQHRSQQIATLSGISHEMFTDPEFGKMLDDLSEKNGLDELQRKNVALIRKDYNKQKKYPTSFVIELSKTTSESYHAWVKAKKAKDYSLFREALGKLVKLKRQETEIVGYEDHPYDALVDEFEPGAKTKDLAELFADVREKLVVFVNKLKEKSQVNADFLYKNYPSGKQWDYGLKVLAQMGYDFDAGRQDVSPHPFTTNFSPNDVRVTTRIDENDLGNMIWSCIHEGGHALYEQGLPTEQYGLPLGSYLSLGIHESQSRLWENNVGRSLAYWKANYANLQSVFPENLGNVELLDFYKAINRVEPNLIRTEGDELHYHFHILIRFEIEKGLIEGSLEVDDLDQVWNQKYRDYMGVEVPNDSKGILQDIHWSHGSIGYFPTYSLGSFYAAQFYAQAEKEIPGLASQIESGDSSQLLTWLQQNIHQHGRRYTAEELCRKITGESLNFDYFMKYVESKYAGIYN